MKPFKSTFMMTRIVRLSFKLQHRQEFLNIFEKHKASIQKFSGFHQIKLLEEIGNKGVFFTHSIWQKEESLEEYRASEYFKEIWTTIKPWFNERAQAWSLEEK